MSGFTYPTALYDLVKKRWLQISSSRKFVPPLLDEASFREILDVAFHASFLTEEGRRQWFRVTYMSYKDLEEGRIVNADSIKSVKFKKPRNFNVNELVKLAPAADPTQVLIGVDRGDNGLSIWGLIEAGMSWWKYGRHEISGAPSPPNTFTISSKTPGQVTVSCMGEIVVTLNQGRILESSASIFEEGPVAEFLKGGRSELYKRVAQRLEEEGVDVSNPNSRAYIESQYATFLERILIKIREKFHGGVLIVIPDETEIDDGRLKSMISIKYPCHYDSSDLLINELVEYFISSEIYSRLSGKEQVSKDAFDYYHTNEYYLEEAEEWVTRAVCFISSLSAVDGAVIITDRLRLLGFGAEITAVSSGLETVKVVSDFSKNIGERKSIDLFGTRHRSAFRFCSSFEDSVAFIVSQDGEIRLAKGIGSEVFVWSNINITSTGF